MKTSRVGTIVGVVFISALLVLYLVFTANIAVVLWATGQPIGMAMAVALFILPAIALWALVRELLFGVRSAVLTRILDSEGALPVDNLPHRPSGRTVREAADLEFPAYAAAVDAAPNDWRAWFRLGLAYDASGDRRRARSSIRTAISLSRSERAQKSH